MRVGRTQLYDIVRLYETRDSKGSTPGKTTMQEAQLIGRGARYMPFTAPDQTNALRQRKFDNDIQTVESCGELHIIGCIISLHFRIRRRWNRW